MNTGVDRVISTEGAKLLIQFNHVVARREHGNEWIMFMNGEDAAEGAVNASSIHFEDLLWLAGGEV